VVTLGMGLAVSRVLFENEDYTGGAQGTNIPPPKLFGIDVDAIGHPGNYGGFRSSFLVIPDRDAVFVGLTSSTRGARALAEIEAVFFERVIGARRPVPETVELPAEVLDGFAGTYANSTTWTEVQGGVDGLVITVEEEELPSRAIGERTFEVTTGEAAGDRFDFPLEGFGRFGSRLAERVS